MTVTSFPDRGQKNRLGPPENGMASQRLNVPEPVSSRQNKRPAAVSPRVLPTTVIAVLLASVLIATGAAFKNEERCGVFPETRVINGILATQGMFPWLVRLLVYINDGEPPSTCGGSIITKWHIVTAAHCVLGKEGMVRKIELVYGAVDTKSKYAKKMQAKSAAVHPRFTSDGYHDDIAVLRLPEALEYTEYVKPVCLDFDLGELAGQTVTVAGWGEPKKKYGPVDQLRYTKLKVVAQDECQRKLQMYHFNSSSMMCAYEQDRDACQGDSGSALMLRKEHRYHLIAVVSHGSGCAQDLPGIYTPVKAHQEWILETIEDKSAFKPFG